MTGTEDPFVWCPGYIANGHCGMIVVTQTIPVVVSRLFMDFIFQHLRFHDYIVHLDRDTVRTTYSVFVSFSTN